MDKSKAQYIEGIVSIIMNLILFILKIWAGAVTGSIALIADAWHTLSDSFSSIVVVAAAKLSSKRADKKHPFGHGRWEYIASLFIAFFLGIIAYEFFRNSIARFNNKEHVEFGVIAIIVTIVSIVVKELLAQYAFYLGRKTENLIVRADGWHHRTDALSSVVVLIGILFAKKFWWIDSVLGIIIALMIFYVAFEITKETITKILGEEPGDDLINRITGEIINAYHDDLKIHHFHLHNYVLHQELTLHIRLRKHLTIETGHRIASVIEERIQDKFGMVTTIHVEPLE
ncbi:MAG: cation diffusion facilitator family transporter [Treponema sp.]|nr:cation diffusion facilitator family transporter [Treponema sp.]